MNQVDGPIIFVIILPVGKVDKRPTDLFHMDQVAFLLEVNLQIVSCGAY